MYKLRFWFPFAVYSTLIFGLSSLAGNQVTLTHIFWDKGLHAIEYLPLGMCAAYGVYNSRLPWPWMGLWLLAGALCFAYGLSDEWHQSFVPGREASIWDAGADFWGGLFGAGLYLLSKKYMIYSTKNIS